MNELTPTLIDGKPTYEIRLLKALVPVDESPVPYLSTAFKENEELQYLINAVTALD